MPQDVLIKDAYWKSYYVANREKKLAQARERYRANSEEILRKQMARKRSQKRPSKMTTEERRQHYAKLNRIQLLRHKYGMTEADYDRLALSQGSRCAVCLRTGQKLVIDHCHDSGDVRGLLCANCNCAIGLLQDCPEVVANALLYLTPHKRVPS